MRPERWASSPASIAAFIARHRNGIVRHGARCFDAVLSAGRRAPDRSHRTARLSCLSSSRLFRRCYQRRHHAGARRISSIPCSNGVFLRMIAVRLACSQGHPRTLRHKW